MNHEKVTNQQNISIFLIEAKDANININCSLTNPHMGFICSLESELDAEIEKIDFPLTEGTMFIFNGTNGEMEQLIKEAKDEIKKYVKFNKFNDYYDLEDFHLSDNFLVWRIPGEADKYFCLITTTRTYALMDWYDDKKLMADKISFRCGNLYTYIPTDFTQESRHDFFRHYENHIIGDEKAQHMGWEMMGRLEKQTYESNLQKKMLNSVILPKEKAAKSIENKAKI